MRKLDGGFLKALKEGSLCRLLDTVKSDSTLCLELRGASVNVYYRGGSLLKVERRPNDDYGFHFDRNYFPDPDEVDLPGRTDVAAWIEAVPELKQTIDRFLAKHGRDEREFQQLLLRENNFGSIARSTDYYVCDIEHQSGNSRFDLVAVHWPSKPQERKKGRDRRLVFMEMKYGDGALDEPAGVRSHIEDVDEFLSDHAELRRFKQDMAAVFNQKRDLGLLDCGKCLENFSDEKPLLLLVFANHDPEKSKLRSVLADLPAGSRVELRIVTASFMGYGLYDQGVHTVDEARERFRDLIHSS